jgi:hypothetical protein
MNLLYLIMITLSLSTVSSTHSALADDGVGSGGGGDKCQDRIESIRNNISDWIVAGHSSELNFKNTKINVSAYNQSIQNLVALTRADNQGSISCTSNRDEVRIEGAYKTCRSYFENNDSSKPRILCYNKFADGKATDGFMALSEEDQYFQVHHELAVLAAFEDQTGANSNYPLSDQISAKLENREVKMLPVEKDLNCSTCTKVNNPGILDLPLDEALRYTQVKFRLKKEILVSDTTQLISGEPFQSPYMTRPLGGHIPCTITFKNVPVNSIYSCNNSDGSPREILLSNKTVTTRDVPADSNPTADPSLLFLNMKLTYVDIKVKSKTIDGIRCEKFNSTLTLRDLMDSLSEVFEIEGNPDFNAPVI